MRARIAWFAMGSWIVLLAAPACAGDGAALLTGESLTAMPEPERIARIAELGDRGDPAAEPALRACLDGSEAVRWAALRALGQLGVPPSQVFPLPRAATAEQARQYEFALLTAADVRAARGDCKSAESFYAALAGNSSRSEVWSRALKGLAGCESERLVPLSLGFLGTPGTGEVAASLLTESALPGVNEKLATAWPAMAWPVRVMLLDILTARKAPELDELLARAASDEHVEVRLAAARLQGLSPTTADILEALLSAAREADIERFDALAAEVLARPAPEDRDAVRVAFEKVLGEEACGDAAKTRALAGLERLAPLESAAAVKRLLDDRSLGAAAACAFAAITCAHAEPAEAREVLETLAERTPYPEVVACAGTQLTALGIDVSALAKRLGYVTRWTVLGAFPPAGARTAPAPKSSEIQPGTPFEYAGSAYEWTELPGTGLPPSLDLRTHYQTAGLAFAHAAVQATGAMPVSLYVNATAPVGIWLNGSVLYPSAANPARYQTELEPGTNSLLVRTESDSTAWTFTLRITDRTGKPVDLNGVPRKQYGRDDPPAVMLTGDGWKEPHP